MRFPVVHPAWVTRSKRSATSLSLPYFYSFGPSPVGPGYFVKPQYRAKPFSVFFARPQSQRHRTRRTTSSAISRNRHSRIRRSSAANHSSLEDENGMAQGNDCARGFMRGTVRATTAGLSLSTMRSATDLILTMMLCQSTTKNRRCAPIRSAQRARKSHRAHGGWAFGRLSVFFGRIGRSVPVPTRVNHGTMFPRLEGTLPARAAPGRSTSSAAAGRP